MVSTNIPLNKLSNVEFLKCLQVYFKKDVPTESALRKFLINNYYEETMVKIRQRVFNRKIWV